MTVSVQEVQWNWISANIMSNMNIRSRRENGRVRIDGVSLSIAVLVVLGFLREAVGGRVNNIA